LGLCPRPRLQCSPDSLAAFKGPTSRGGESDEKIGEGRRKKAMGGRTGVKRDWRREERGTPTSRNPGYAHVVV